MKKLLTIITLLTLLVPSVLAQCSGSHTNPAYADTTAGSSVDVTPTECASLAACNTQAWNTATLTTATPNSLSAIGLSECTESPFSLTNTDIIFETSVVGQTGDLLVRTVVDEANNDVFAIGNNNEEIILNAFEPQTVGVDPYLASFDMTTGAVNWQLEGSDSGDQYAIDIDYINGKVVALSNAAPGANGNNVHVHNAITSAEICKVNIDNAGNDVELQALTVFDLAGTDKAYLVGKIDDGVNTAPLALRLDLTTCTIDWSKQLNAGAIQIFWDVIADSSDNGIVAGQIDTSGGDSQAIVFTFDASGNFVSILGADTSLGTCDNFLQIRQLPSGKFALGGHVCGTGNTNRMAVCIFTAGSVTFDDCKKYNNNGDTGITTLWDVTYDTTGDIYVSGANTASTRTLMGSFSVSGGTMTEKWFAENILAGAGSDILYTLGVVGTNVLAGGQGDATNWAMISRDTTAGTIQDIDYFSTGNNAYINHMDVSTTAAYAVGEGTKFIMAYEPNAPPVPVPEFSDFALLLAALIGLGVIFTTRKRL